MSKEQKDKGVIMSKKYDYLVVGAGLYGAVFAHEAKEAGKSVLVIDNARILPEMYIRKR